MNDEISQIDESIQKTVDSLIENEIVEDDDCQQIEKAIYKEFMDDQTSLDDLNDIPDFSEIQEKIDEKRSRFSNVKTIVGQPVIFTQIFVIPKKFSNSMGHKCFINCITISDNKHHAVYSCSSILSRQFSEIFSVLYNKTVKKKDRFHIDKLFKGIINIHSIPGKNSVYLKLSTTIQTEETKDVSSSTVSESTATRA